MTLEILAFALLALTAFASALVVITHRNAVVSALALAFNLVSIAGFYLLLGAQFVGFLQVIVYAGAIMVLILFVVMLLNLREEAKGHPAGNIQRWLAPVMALFLVGVLVRTVLSGSRGGFPVASTDFGTAGSVGRELFSRFYYPFEVISILLVAAMVGAVLLAKRKL